MSKRDLNIEAIVRYLMFFQAAWFYFSGVVLVLKSDPADKWFWRIFAAFICLGFYGVMKSVSNLKGKIDE